MAGRAIPSLCRADCGVQRTAQLLAFASTL